jgi:hypothetical protein
MNKLFTLIIVILFNLAFVIPTHIRYGDFYFDRIGDDQLRIFVSNGWRSDFTQSTTIEIFEFDTDVATTTSGSSIATLSADSSDPNEHQLYGTSNGATIYRDQYEWTIPDLTKDYLFRWKLANRLHGLGNAPDAVEILITSIFRSSDPDNYYSPAGAIPFTWFFDEAGVTTKDIPIIHPAGESFVCRDFDPNGVTTNLRDLGVVVSPDCQITVDGTQLSTNTLYVMGIEAEDARGNIIQIDFFIHLTDDGYWPTCDPVSFVNIVEDTDPISYTFNILEVNAAGTVPELLEDNLGFYVFGDTDGITTTPTEYADSDLPPNTIPAGLDSGETVTIDYTFVSTDEGKNKFGYIQLTDGAYYENCIYNIVVFPCSNFPPELICPTPVTVQATGSTCEYQMTTTSFTATVDENTSCPLTVTDNDFNSNGSLDASGTYVVGTTIVGFSATDNLDRSSTCSSSVTVEQTPFSCAADHTLTLDASNNYHIDISTIDIAALVGHSECIKSAVVELSTGDSIINLHHHLHILEGNTITVDVTVTDSFDVVTVCNIPIIIVIDNSACQYVVSPEKDAIKAMYRRFDIYWVSNSVQSGDRLKFVLYDPSDNEVHVMGDDIDASTGVYSYIGLHGIIPYDTFTIKGFVSHPDYTNIIEVCGTTVYAIFHPNS